MAEQPDKNTARRQAQGVISLASYGAIKRPEPPDELSGEEAAIWRKITQRMPANWFSSESLHLLQSLCCCISTARSLEAELRAMQEAGDILDKRFKTLLLLRHREIKNVADLSARLRLSPQSRLDQRVAGVGHRRAPPDTPWNG